MYCHFLIRRGWQKNTMNFTNRVEWLLTPEKGVAIQLKLQRYTHINQILAFTLYA